MPPTWAAWQEEEKIGQIIIQILNQYCTITSSSYTSSYTGHDINYGYVIVWVMTKDIWHTQNMSKWVSNEPDGQQ